MQLGPITPAVARSSSLKALALSACLPVLVAFLLCLPVLGLEYFWDDYVFLTNAQANSLTDLLPTPHAMFYRPISRGLYYLLLFALGPSGKLAGHLVNLAVLGLSIVLLVSLTSKLAGRRAGVLAGLAFATLAPVPSLVAWTSGAQDLFAIAFLLAALFLRHAGRPAGALAVAACALLSKESTVAAFPVLILWDWILERRPYRVPLYGFLYGSLGLVWAAIHPGLRLLFSHGFRLGTSGYVGLGSPERWGDYSSRYIVTLLNLPIMGVSTPWPADRTLYGALALALILGCFWLARRDARWGDRVVGISLRRAALLAALLAIPAILLPSVLIRTWTPYLACLAGIGSSFLIGILLAKASFESATACITGYLILGIWSRGMLVPGGLVLTERNFVDSSRAIGRVKESFLNAHPSLPRGSQVLLSIAGTGPLGVFQTMYEGRALRIWYADPTLLTIRPERRQAGNRPEYLFRITSGLDVVEIDVDRHQFRATSKNIAEHINREEMSSPIRTYARGVAASGDPERAVRILQWVSQIDRGSLWSQYDLRLIGMVLSAAGRKPEAARIFETAAGFRGRNGLIAVAMILEDPTESAALDSCAFQAFGVSPWDPEALRFLMRSFEASGYSEQMLRTASRLQTLAPGDSESAELIRTLDNNPRRREPTTSADMDPRQD